MTNRTRTETIRFGPSLRSTFEYRNVYGIALADNTRVSHAVSMAVGAVTGQARRFALLLLSHTSRTRICRNHTPISFAHASHTQSPISGQTKSYGCCTASKSTTSERSIRRILSASRMPNRPEQHEHQRPLRAHGEGSPKRWRCSGVALHSSCHDHRSRQAPLKPWHRPRLPVIRLAHVAHTQIRKYTSYSKSASEGSGSDLDVVVAAGEYRDKKKLGHGIRRLLHRHRVAAAARLHAAVNGGCEQRNPDRLLTLHDDLLLHLLLLVLLHL